MYEIQKFTVDPTVDLAVHASGDTVSADIEVTDVLPIGGGAFLEMITIRDNSAEGKALDVLIFDGEASGTTFTNNAALDMADLDLDKLVGIVNVPATAYFAFVDNKFAVVKDICMPIRVDTSTSLWVALVSRSDHDFVAAGDLRVSLFIRYS